MSSRSCCRNAALLNTGECDDAGKAVFLPRLAYL